MNKTDKYRKAVDIINQCFDAVGIQSRISASDILIGNQTVCESIKEMRVFETYYAPIFHQKLSNIIFNHYYPQPTGTTFFHFTSMDAFESIVNNGEIWLFSLSKRFNHGEFRLFYEDHQMLGYKERVEEGKPLGFQIMEDTFYIAFARSEDLEDEESLWRSFGEKGLGVRLEFEITPRLANFRNVYYEQENDSKLLLKNINTRLKLDMEGRVLLIPGLSKIGAFYIQGDFETETESRLVIKKVSDSYQFNFEEFVFPGKEQVVKYIKLKFDSSFANIKLLSVKAGERADKAKIEEIVRKSPFQIPVI